MRENLRNPCPAWHKRAIQAELSFFFHVDMRMNLQSFQFLNLYSTDQSELKRRAGKS